jgi:lipoyl(octanoyl) transferase
LAVGSQEPGSKSRQVIFNDLGLIDYKQCWDYQEQLFKELIDRKVRNRDLSEDEKEQARHYLLFCEHPHVYTLGKSGSESNLLVNEQQLAEKKATFYRINRGGDITYHGPGQIVGYPILDLDHFFTDIHKYLRYLEEAVILTLAGYGIEAGRVEGLTGVWIEGHDPGKARKICALGVRASRWVTMHGFAFNVNTDLDYFDNIVPCGIDDKAVTSMEKELGKSLDMSEVKEKLKKHIAQLFDMQVV